MTATSRPFWRSIAATRAIRCSTCTAMSSASTILRSPVGANIEVNSPSGRAAIPVINALRASRRVERGYLGIGIAPVGEDMAAALGLPRIAAVRPARRG